MTDFGIEVKDPTGRVVFDRSDISARIVWQKSVLAGASGNENVSLIQGKKTFEFGVCISAGGLNPPVVTRSGINIAWAPFSGGDYWNNGDSIIFVVVYD